MKSYTSQVFPPLEKWITNNPSSFPTSSLTNCYIFFYDKAYIPTNPKLPLIPMYKSTYHYSQQIMRDNKEKPQQSSHKQLAKQHKFQEHNRRSLFHLYLSNNSAIKKNTVIKHRPKLNRFIFNMGRFHCYDIFNLLYIPLHRSLQTLPCELLFSLPSYSSK